jgi:hypothetical protein
MKNKISVWIDRTETKPVVIVSLDSEDSSTTLKTYRYSETQTAARAFALAVAKRRGMECVIERPEGSGQWVPLADYSPRYSVMVAQHRGGPASGTAYMTLEDARRVLTAEQNRIDAMGYLTDRPDVYIQREDGQRVR